MNCGIAGCSTGARMATKTLCWTHYQRLRRYGRADLKKKRDFWESVDMSAGENCCWPWMRGLASAGYGWIERGYAHRLAYELSKDHIPPGMVVDHRCFNTICCNPKHLRLLTSSENSSLRRAPAASRAERKSCPHRIGGILPENLKYVSPHGAAHCRECFRIRHGTWQARRKAAIRANRASA